MKKSKFWWGLLACTLFSSMFMVSAKTQEINAEPKRDTELVIVVDKSGSMYGLAGDTIGSYNSMIQEQKDPNKEGNVYVTTVMFNQNSQKVHDRKDIKDVEKITRKEYSPGGCTALLDAVGGTITQLSANDSVRKNKVIFVVITDGYENASREFKKEQIKKLIEEKTKEGWEFVFLGANIDSVKESGNIGIMAERTRDFDASSDGIVKAFKCVSTAINQVRSNKAIDLDEAETQKKEVGK